MTKVVFACLPGRAREGKECLHNERANAVTTSRDRNQVVRGGQKMQRPQMRKGLARIAMALKTGYLNICFYVYLYIAFPNAPCMVDPIQGTGLCMHPALRTVDVPQIIDWLTLHE